MLEILAGGKSFIVEWGCCERVRLTLEEDEIVQEDELLQRAWVVKEGFRTLFPLVEARGLDDERVGRFGLTRVRTLRRRRRAEALGWGGR